MCDMSIFEVQGDRNKAIRALFCNAYYLLVRILRRACTTTYLADLKETAVHHVTVRNLDVNVEILKQAESLSAVFQALGTDEQWNDLHFLSTSVMCLPDEAVRERQTALMVLNHYRSHLRAYRKAMPIKDGAVVLKTSNHDHIGGDFVHMEITLAEDIDKLSCEDCVKVGNHFFGYDFDHNHFCDARPGNSTTLVFIVPKTLVRKVQEKLSSPDVLWMMKELGVCRVQSPGLFNKDVTKALSPASIREGLQSGVDFVSQTEVCACCVSLMCMCGTYVYKHACIQH